LSSLRDLRRNNSASLSGATDIGRAAAAGGGGGAGGRAGAVDGAGIVREGAVAGGRV
jgi:hypothetical protein